MQPICAACEKPCDPVFERIEVAPGALPREPSDVTLLGSSYSATAFATNKGRSSQMLTATFSIAQQLTATMQFADAFQHSDKAILEVRAAADRRRRRCTRSSVFG